MTSQTRRQYEGGTISHTPRQVIRRPEDLSDRAPFGVEIGGEQTPRQTSNSEPPPVLPDRYGASPQLQPLVPVHHARQLARDIAIRRSRLQSDDIDIGNRCEGLQRGSGA